MQHSSVFTVHVRPPRSSTPIIRARASRRSIAPPRAPREISPPRPPPLVPTPHRHHRSSTRASPHPSRSDHPFETPRPRRARRRCDRARAPSSFIPIHRRGPITMSSPRPRPSIAPRRSTPPRVRPRSSAEVAHAPSTCAREVASRVVNGPLSAPPVCVCGTSPSSAPPVCVCIQCRLRPSSAPPVCARAPRRGRRFHPRCDA